MRDIRTYYLDDGPDSGWRVVVSGTETGVYLLPEALPLDAPLHEILRAAAEATAPPPLTEQQQEIAGMLAAGTPRQAIAAALRVSLSSVDRVARLVQGPARAGRPRKAAAAHD